MLHDLGSVATLKTAVGTIGVIEHPDKEVQISVDGKIVLTLTPSCAIGHNGNGGHTMLSGTFDEFREVTSRLTSNKRRDSQVPSTATAALLALIERTRHDPAVRVAWAKLLEQDDA